MGSSAEPPPPCHVVAVPYPGRGHVNAMLNLCRILAARDGVTATVVVTEEWLGLLGGAAAAAAEGGVRLEAIPNVVPSEHGRAGDMLGFVRAVYTRMEAPFERLLDRLALGAAPPARRHRGRHVRAAVGGRRRQPEWPAGVRPLAAQRHHVLRALSLRPPAHGHRHRRYEALNIMKDRKFRCK